MCTRPFKPFYFLTLYLLFIFHLKGSESFTVSNVTCSGSKLLDLRIEGCLEPPCKIKKGQELPFEVDLSFNRPSVSADDVYFNVFLPKYAAPPHVHGSTLITSTCDQGNLGFKCPINADTAYTVKSSLKIDPEAVCTANCERIGANGTGLRQTKWRWSISNRRDKRKKQADKTSHKGRNYSVCQFSLMLDIVE